MTISIKAPSAEQIQDLAAGFGMELGRADADGVPGHHGGDAARPMPGSTSWSSRRCRSSTRAPPATARRRRTTRSTPGTGSATSRARPTGVLQGKPVAIKDNICVAGVPMANGSRVLEGYVPDVDATVVTRILDAGGRIAGKAACEDLCFSAGSHTCVTGPIRNPWAPEYSAGGSSGGSAALVASGVVELALGGDQGGSIRTPSCWCGAYGLKPTWGLVPLHRRHADRLCARPSAARSARARRTSRAC